MCTFSLSLLFPHVGHGNSNVFWNSNGFPMFFRNDERKAQDEGRTILNVLNVEISIVVGQKRMCIRRDSTEESYSNLIWHMKV